MKITIDRLKEIILEEIDKTDQTNESVLGLPPGTTRMPMLNSPMASLTPKEPEEASFTNFAELFSKIMDAPGGKLNLNKADTKTLASMIAQRNLKEQ